MRISNSKISCGIWQLSGVDDSNYDENKPTAKKLAKALRTKARSQYYDAPHDGQVIIASLAGYQSRAKKFLKAEGFKAVSKAARNPNSGNKIVLYMKRLSGKDVKRYKKLAD